MIIDSLLILPTLLLGFIWGLLPEGQAFDPEILQGAQAIGSQIARMDFLVPLDILHQVVLTYMTALTAYLVYYSVHVVIDMWNKLKPL